MTVIFGADREPTATAHSAAYTAAYTATARTALAGRVPVVSAERLLAELVPPPRFSGARFENYVPDPAEPSQAAARDLLATWAGEQEEGRHGGQGVGGIGRLGARLLRRNRPAPSVSGVYLDGGYGVGKTHLLASLWHATQGSKAYGTFVEYTHLLGALGFAACTARLATRSLVCIDEFELDDPGDTVLVSTLLSRLAEAGVRLAATSNTLPDRLGEGRFAADDFRREIQGLAARFATVRIDGPDYRRRDAAAAPRPATERELAAYLDAYAGSDAAASGVAVDEFDDLVEHLSALHPSRYGALLDGVGGVALRGLRPIDDQNAALRLVVLIDRLYDRSIPVLACGAPVDRLFAPQLLAGGFRKKYLRAASRLVSLATAGAALLPTA